MKKLNRFKAFLYLCMAAFLFVMAFATACHADRFEWSRGMSYDAVNVVNVTTLDSACNPCEVHVCQYLCTNNEITLGRFHGNVGDTVTYIFMEPKKAWNGAAWPDSGFGLIYNVLGPEKGNIRLRGKYWFKFKPSGAGVKPKSHIPNHIFGREPFRVDGRVFS